MTSIHPELKKAIKNNKLVVFAGSGTSINCGFPDWKNLVAEILTRLQTTEPVYEHFKPLVKENKLTPLQVLNVIEDKEKATVLDIISEKLILNEDVGLELHKKIIELSPKIITTNYDKSFEEAWGPSAKVIHNDDPYSLWRLKDYTEYIFKIHGDINKPSDCVLFENQYLELYAREEFWIGFMNLLMNSTLLFIGFSLSDPYVNSILIKIKHMHKGLTNKHFIITTDKSFEVTELKEVIIPIVIDSYSDLSNTLDELIPFVTNLPERPYNKLIGRDDRLVDIMKFLKENSSVIIIQGPSGVGKTSLAIEAGYACLQKTTISLTKQTRFNNVVWLSVVNIAEKSSYLNTIFDIIGRAFDSEKITKISDRELWKKDWEVYQVLQANRTLLIIDNFETLRDAPELLQWVQRIPGNCKILITTSENILIPGEPIMLEGLSSDNAFELITSEISQAQLPQNLTKNDLMFLIEQTKGNPRALQLAAGQVKQGTINITELRREKNILSLDYFHNQTWEQLSENSKKFLLLFSVFSNSNSMAKIALFDVCSNLGIDFNAAAEECGSLNLLVISDDLRYFIPPQSRTYIKGKCDRPYQKEVKDNWTRYYLSFIRKHVVRNGINDPDEPYWNALVSDKMTALKKEWSAINDVLNWVKDDPAYHADLIEMVFLLVHYMDSRFYNQDRLIFVEAAIKAAETLNLLYEKSLLRIDALGWTYVEESDLDKAKEQIVSGLQDAEELKRTNPEKAKDLLALGHAWLARVEIENNNSKEAFKAIKKVRSYRGKAWILYRVYMASGDIYVHEKKFKKALEFYEQAKTEYNKYEGEGHDYQINPRIGLALLRNGRIAEAKRIFEAQINKDIPIGTLYAEYGLALVVHQHNKDDAIKKLKELDEEISTRTSSNVLLKLIRTFRDEQEKIY